MQKFITTKALMADIFGPDLRVKRKDLDGTIVALENQAVAIDEVPVDTAIVEGDIPATATPAVEEQAADGVTRVELEKVYYCKIANFEQLDGAAKKIHQEQWTLKPEVDIPGCVRVRANDDKEYILTVKCIKNEVELVATKDMFEAFRGISNNGMIKDRFEFPIDVEQFANEEDKTAWKDLKWEVDVYFNEDGTYAEWCKVDLEVPSAELYKGNVRPPFPIEFSEVMTGDRSKLNEEQTAFLNNLFDTVFISRNAQATASVEGVGDFFRDMGKSLTRGGAISSLLKIGFTIASAGFAAVIFGFARHHSKAKITKLLNKEGAAVMSGGVSRENIESVEKELGFTFGVKYRTFLKKAGAMVVRGTKIYGICTIKDASLSVLKHTQAARTGDEKFPKDVAVIRNGDGGLVCIDSRDKIFVWKNDKLEDLKKEFTEYVGDLLADLADKEEAEEGKADDGTEKPTGKPSTEAIAEAPLKPAQEGLLDAFFSWFKRKDSKSEGRDEGLVIWVTENTKDGKLSPSLKLIDGSIDIGFNLATFFKRGGNIKPEDFYSEVKNDFDLIKQLWNSNKSHLEKCIKAKDDFTKDLTKLAGEGDWDWDAVFKLILTLKTKFPTPLSDTFKEPHYTFLGNYTEGFVNAKGGQKTLILTPQRDFIVKEGEVTSVAVISQKDMDSLLETALFLGKVIKEILDTQEAAYDGAIDVTEDPLRAFAEDIENSDTAVDLLKDVLDPTDGERNYNLIENLLERAGNLENAIWRYVRLAHTPEAVASTEAAYNNDVADAKVDSEGITDSVESAEEVTVSQEGLGDFITSVKNLFSKKKPGAKLTDGKSWDEENRKELKTLADTVKKFYLNDSWLNSQKFVTGNVTAKDITSDLEFDKEVKDPLANIEKASKELEAASAKWLPYCKQLDDKVQAIDKETKAKSKQAKTDEEVIAVWKEGADKLSKLYASISFDAFPHGVSLLGGKLLTVDHSKTAVDKFVILKNGEAKNLAELPALSKEDIKKAATVILGVLENKIPNLAEDNTYWLDHSDGDDETTRISDIDEGVYGAYYDNFYHQSVEFSLMPDLSYYFDGFEVIRALERWIDRSIV